MFGAPPEKYWPYNIAKFDVEPAPFLYALGADFKAVKYFRLSPPETAPAQILLNIKNYLAGSFPSMFGFPVYPEYDNPTPGPLIGFPGPGEHAEWDNVVLPQSSTRESRRGNS